MRAVEAERNHITLSAEEGLQVQKSTRLHWKIGGVNFKITDTNTFEHFQANTQAEMKQISMDVYQDNWSHI